MAGAGSVLSPPSPSPQLCPAPADSGGGTLGLDCSPCTSRRLEAHQMRPHHHRPPHPRTSRGLGLCAGHWHVGRARPRGQVMPALTTGCRGEALPGRGAGLGQCGSRESRGAPGWAGARAQDGEVGDAEPGWGARPLGREVRLGREDPVRVGVTGRGAAWGDLGAGTRPDRQSCRRSAPGGTTGNCSTAQAPALLGPERPLLVRPAHGP